MARGSGYTKPTNWKAITKRILARDGHRCYITGCAERAISVDHIVPVARGGSHDDHNLGAICATHKRVKDEADRIDGIRLAARRRSAKREPERHPNLAPIISLDA